MKQFQLILGILFLATLCSAQTADPATGCATLDVEFEGPAQTSYFWEFGDGATSTEKDPQNSFINPGTYVVELFLSQGGTKTGEVTVTVFPEIQVDITKSTDLGCVPLTVDFTSNIVSDPGITIEQIKWAFDDGSTGTGSSVTHTYTLENIFNVGLEITTTPSNCEISKIFPDPIESEKIVARFSADDVACDFPEEITFRNTSTDDPRYTYEWDFGNNDTATGYNAGKTTYSNRGTYTASLIVTSPSGCADTTEKVIIIGRPIIDVRIPDTLCVREPYTIVNNTEALEFDWRYGSPAIRTFVKDPVISFSRGGNFQIRLKASNSETCFEEVVFDVFVEEPNVSFDMDPPEFCMDNLEKTFIAKNSNHVTYIWNQRDTSSNSTFTIPESEERDSLYINLPDSIKGTLEAISASGCYNRLDTAFGYQLAEAYYIPDTTLGLGVLTVTFDDYSTSLNPIVRRFWDYDDGTTAELDPSIVQHTHTYRCTNSADSRTYYPKLFVEDEQGCTDLSKVVEIEVICFDTITLEGEAVPSFGGGFLGCAGSEINVQFIGSGRIDWHVYTDEERIDHCWTTRFLTHEYEYPGIWPFAVIPEYKGMPLIEEPQIAFEVEVVGTKAIIEYELPDCEDPFTFIFDGGKSIDADVWTWYVDGNEESDRRRLTHTFTEPGEHEVVLETVNTPSDCPPDNDTVIVYVTQPISDFILPEKVCDNEPVILNAEPARDVFGSCHHGYLWEFDFQRPRETGNEGLFHFFERGLNQEVTLTVEDINGCTSSSTQTIDVYGIDPLNNLDSTTCLPYPKQLQDLSDSDTTLVSWDWSFGSTEQNPFYEFDSLDRHEEFMDSLFITMVVEDAIGCVDSITRIVRIEEPNFFIQSSVGSRACQGDSIIFTVIDTAGIDSDYQFEWTMGDSGDVLTGTEVVYAFDENTSGRQTITLNYVHNNGNCGNFEDKILIITPAPIAGFTNDLNEVDCYPKQITFNVDSTLLNQGYEFLWKFGDGKLSDLEEPVFSFGKGTHTVWQIIGNELGCQDSISFSFTLDGPSADITADKLLICSGDEVTFTVSNLESVEYYRIDFGDGTFVENTPEVTHTFAELDSIAQFAKFIVRKGNCTVTDTLPVIFSDVKAEFAIECDGTVLSNLSVGATDYEWDFGNGQTSTDPSPEIPPGDVSSITQITLTATDAVSGCFDTFTPSSFTPGGGVFKMANLFSPNGDSHNDLFFPIDVRTIQEEDIVINSFKIYNRWGQLVYDNISPAGWNGYFEGAEAPPEVYAYFIELSITGCGNYTQKGNVTLIR